MNANDPAYMTGYIIGTVIGFAIGLGLIGLIQTVLLRLAAPLCGLREVDFGLAANAAFKATFANAGIGLVYRFLVLPNLDPSMSNASAGIVAMVLGLASIAVTILIYSTVLDTELWRAVALAFMQLVVAIAIVVVIVLIVGWRPFGNGSPSPEPPGSAAPPKGPTVASFRDPGTKLFLQEAVGRLSDLRRAANAPTPPANATSQPAAPAPPFRQGRMHPPSRVIQRPPGLGTGGMVGPGRGVIPPMGGMGPNRPSGAPGGPPSGGQRP